jgi:hypothetical protein
MEGIVRNGNAERKIILLSGGKEKTLRTVWREMGLGATVFPAQELEEKMHEGRESQLLREEDRRREAAEERREQEQGRQKEASEKDEQKEQK